MLRLDLSFMSLLYDSNKYDKGLGKETYGYVLSRITSFESAVSHL